MERRSPYHVKLSGETNRKVKRNMVKRWQNRLIKQRPGDILDSHVPPRAESIRGGPRPRGRAAPRPRPPTRTPPAAAGRRAALGEGEGTRLAADQY